MKTVNRIHRVLFVEELELRSAPALMITSVTPSGAVNPFDTIEVYFNEAVQDFTFDMTDVAIAGGGAAISSVNKIAADHYQIATTGTGLGTYSLTIGPVILDDATGNQMDQDRDGTQGEVGEDEYSAALFSNGATISDATYDGQSVVICGNTVTLSGSRTFDLFEVYGGATVNANGDALDVYDLNIDGTAAVCTFNLAGGATLTAANMITITGNSSLVCESKDNTGQVLGEWVGVGVTINAANVSVAAGSTISADGEGYVTGKGPGWAGAGGSHGGKGYSGGPTYGDSLAPTELGSGGSVLGGGDWSNGGGAIALWVGNTLTLDGEISADGQNQVPGTFNIAGAAGGSVFITAGVIAGAGSISADGSAGNCGQGGGGGRVAVYYADGATFTGFTASSAAGAPGGENGTTGFFDTSVANNHLYVYENFLFAQDSVTHLGALTMDDSATVTLEGGAVLDLDGDLTIQGSSTMVCESKDNTGQVGGEWVGVGVAISAANVTIAAGSTVSADGQGYISAKGPGYVGAAGSHGGKGYNGGPTYGDSFAPTDLGSGGSVLGGGDWSNGGGAVTIQVASTLTLDGEISADGQSKEPGTFNITGAAGGSVYITAAVIAGTGSISADGSAGNCGQGGGGGRVAVYYADGATFTGFTASSAAGAPGGEDGTTGFFDTSVANNHLYVYENFLFAQDSVTHLGALTMDDSATVTLEGGAALDLDGDLTIQGSSTMVCESKDNTAQVGGEWVGEGVMIEADNVTVSAGSVISADTQGYATGKGPGWSGSAGSHGGLGWNGGPTYGDGYVPLDLGSGGSIVIGSDWSIGGGAIAIRVNNALTLDGEMSADGQSKAVGAGNIAGAAGGSVFISAASVAGTGSISADGSAGNCGQGGGGGRIAIHYTDTMTLPLVNITATGAPGGADGTVLVNNTPLFIWQEPSDAYLHGTETLGWQVLAVPVSATIEIVAFRSGSSYLATTATGEDIIVETLWDTTTVADNVYDLRGIAWSDTGSLLVESSQTVLVNNSAIWHAGTISANETWAAGTVHIVEEDVTIAGGVTLTVDPGAIVKFVPGVEMTIANTAVLNTIATQSDPIVLTSLFDDAAAGDTNCDGSNSVPQPGDWQGVSMVGTGQWNTTGWTDVRYAVTTHTGAIAADETWSGTSVHWITGNVTVSTGVTLTIEPGAVIKFNRPAGNPPRLGITVESGATLIADATVGQPIVFTSGRDDTVGGDTNQDGDSTTPTAGDWRWVYVNGGTATLDHVELRYGGGSEAAWNNDAAIRATGSASLAVSNSIVKEAFYDGALIAGGSATIENSVFTGIDRGICAQTGGVVVVSNCTLDDNRIGLLAHGGTLTVANTIVSNSIQYGVLHDLGGAPTITYSDVWGSVTANYSGIADQTGLNGNISVAPEYKDATRGNYRLQYCSPMIDAADGAAAPTTDFMGASRYNDPRTADTGTLAANSGIPDMGAFEFVETAESDIDLVVTSIEGPSAVMAGETVTVRWTVTNVGSAPAIGPWHDALYLMWSPDVYPIQVSVDEVLMGAGVVLGPGESYTASADVRVPGSVAGDHHWQVWTNSRGEIFEGRNSDNNTGLSDALVALDLPELVVDGAALNEQFSAVGECAWYKFIPAEGQDVRVSLDLSDNGGATQTYIGYGFVPTRSSFDACNTGWSMADTSAYVSDAWNGVYYVMVYAQRLPSTPMPFDISASSASFNALSVTPDNGGTNGTVTLTVTGEAFPDGASVKIVDNAGAGVDILPISYRQVDATKITATFDLSTAAIGAADVVVYAGAQSSILDDAFQVVAGGASDFWFNIEGPDTVRAGRENVFEITWGNNGTVDAPMQIINLELPAGVDIALEAGVAPISEDLVFLTAATDVAEAVIPAGYSGSFSIYVTCGPISGFWLRAGAVPIDAPELANETIDWESIGPVARPSGSSDVEWDAFWDQLTTQLGDNWSEMAQALATDALARNESNGDGPLAYTGGGVNALSAKLDEIGEANSLTGYSPTGLIRPLICTVQDYSDSVWGGWRADMGSSAIDHAKVECYLDGYAQVDPQRIQERQDTEYDGDEFDANDIETQLWLLAASAKPGDTVFFYYAGHGQEQGLDLPGYDHGQENLTWLEIYSALNWSSASNIVVVLDCCHSGGMIDEIDWRDVGDKWTVITACNNDQLASGSSDGGLFTKAFFDALKQGETLYGAYTHALNIVGQGGNVQNAQWFGSDLNQRLLDPKGEIKHDLPKKPYMEWEEAIRWVTTLLATDPNDKVASGVGAEGWTADGDIISYMIHFENVSTATAPAQQVVITDQLDADLDWSTFELGPIGFNNEVIHLPDGLQTFTTYLNVGTDPNLVEVTVSLDIDTGLVTWTIQSINSVTGGLPEDPWAGFLPPNDDLHSGEGFVMFTIRPNAALPSGTTITNMASIVFDVNPAIDTNITTNTIDVAGPTSQIDTASGASADIVIPLSWSGSDDGGGSGIAGYNIYVSDDGGAYELWLAGTTDTSANFIGMYGHTYDFYSVAVDLVGHREAMPGAPDTTINITGAPPEVWRTLDGQVILYDTDGVIDVIDQDIIVTFDSAGSVVGVKLVGTHAGLGIVINPTGAGEVAITDGRDRTTAPDVSFIACTNPVKQISLYSGVSGWYPGQAMVVEGILADADLDGDGTAGDAVSIYCGGPTKSIKLMGEVGGDIVVQGADDKGYGLSALAVSNGDMLGQVVTTDGGLKALTLTGGDFTGDATINGMLGKMTVKGGSIDGARIEAADYIGSLCADAILNGAEIVVNSMDDGGNSIGALRVKCGDAALDVTTLGGVKSFSVAGGNVSGRLNVGGALGKLSVKAAKDKVTGTLVGGGLAGSLTVSGSLGKLSLSGGDLASDILVKGADSKGYGIGSVQVKGGDVSGGIDVTNGGFKSAKISGGDLLGDLFVNGALGGLSVTHSTDKATGLPVGGTIDGVDVRVYGELKKLTVDNIANDSLIAAALIGGVTVKQDLTDSQIHAGGYVSAGHTWAEGHGSIGGVTIKGNMADSSITAGVWLGTDGLWSGSDAKADTVCDEAGESVISKVSVGGTITATGRCGILAAADVLNVQSKGSGLSVTSADLPSPAGVSYLNYSDFLIDREGQWL